MDKYAYYALRAKMEAGVSELCDYIGYGDEYGLERILCSISPDHKDSLVNTQNPANGKTPVLYAAGYGADSCIELLVKHGAFIDTVDFNERTALMYAVMESHKSTIDLLIRRGVDIDAMDEDRQTALMIAARRNNDEIVRVLINHGADVNAKDFQGRTALTIAAAAARGRYESDSVVNVTLLVSTSRTRWKSIVGLLNGNILQRWNDTKRAKVESAAVAELTRRQMCAIYPSANRQLWPTPEAALAVTVTVVAAASDSDAEAAAQDSGSAAGEKQQLLPHNALITSFFGSHLFEVSVLRIIREYAEYTVIQNGFSHSNCAMP
jgi:Ankyrin repeats (3 copies)/Ankyrin repeat